MRATHSRLVRIVPARCREQRHRGHGPRPPGAWGADDRGARESLAHEPRLGLVGRRQLLLGLEPSPLGTAPDLVRLEHDALAVLELQSPHCSDALREEETPAHAAPERFADIRLDAGRDEPHVPGPQDAHRERPVQVPFGRVLEQAGDGATQRLRHDRALRSRGGRNFALRSQPRSRCLAVTSAPVTQGSRQCGGLVQRVRQRRLREDVADHYALSWETVDAFDVPRE